MNDKQDHSKCLDCSFWRSFNPGAICPKCFDGLCDCPKPFGSEIVGASNVKFSTGLGVASAKSAAPPSPRGST